ncbi:MAG: diaminopimelate decarboxylase [Synergistaceae bacterium]|nr:diaminopimelate decarboxylase [Synergistaceae bacterium]
MRAINFSANFYIIFGGKLFSHEKGRSKISHLTWGGVDCLKLAGTFGTPLYVFDTGIIKSRCRELRETFLNRWNNTRVRYAGKAFLIRAMAKLIADEGIGLDVVSEGELYTALSAGFPPERIEMNGNAKSRREIDYAVCSGVGRIIVDHPDEIGIIESCAKEAGRVQKIMIRVAPGVDAHTHKYIATGSTDSKFGVPADSREGSMLTEAIRFARTCEHVSMRGLHFHVGSQLFDTDDYTKSIEKIIELMKSLKDSLNFTTHELNMGGGFGAVINPAIPAMKSEFYTEPMMKALHEGCAKYGIEIPRVILEPGRWFVSEAGITLYTVENVRELPGITYIAVNGGMSDNPRYALYQAEYNAVKADDIDGEIWHPESGGKVSIVGKCCESGDILIDDAEIQRVKAGDIIALYNTGAYTFSMSSNYNCLMRPAVAFVENGEARVVAERQTLDDIIRGQVI